RIAKQYQIVLVSEGGQWYGHGLELPTVFGEGTTANKCVANTLEAMAVTVATMLELGQTPPKPARQGVRSVQVNVRLTPEEKALMEVNAKQKGFRGLSDFIRAGALTLAK
ncbi:MAG: hypothetical protein K8S55_15790, partial [Phycisphaerae bacterium]|nr:hypothetical protein [Phycisphaerae bacterium]